MPMLEVLPLAVVDKAGKIMLSLLPRKRVAFCIRKLTLFH